MRHFTTPDFWDCYEKLPKSVQLTANKNYELLKRNPKHPSLHFKKVAAYWSVRVGLGYRAVSVELDEGFLWFWIGIHTDYDKLIG